VKIAIFCGSSSSIDPAVNQEAQKLMRFFYDHQIELIYGGAGIGIMGELATNLVNLGGEVTGVIPQQLTHKEIIHAGLKKNYIVKDMHERKKMMYDLSDAFLVFPGGMGTMDEMFEILTWRQIGLHQKPIALFNINGYYDHLLRFLDHAVTMGLVKPHDRELLIDANNWDDLWKKIRPST